MKVTCEAVLSQARAWLGLNEKDGSFKKIIDIYNENRPLPRGYKVKYSDEWCATFISALFIKCNATELISKECSCERFISIFKSMGIWEENGAITPKAGYLILYNWDDKTQPNDGKADHIGIVEKVSGNNITVIEGNRSQSVARRVIKVGYGCIRGYAKPNYLEKAKNTATPAKPSNKKILPAKSMNKTFAGSYITKCDLNLRVGPGTSNSSILVMKKGTRVQNFGYYTKLPSGKIWLYVKLKDGTLGHCSYSYLQEV